MKELKELKVLAEEKLFVFGREIIDNRFLTLPVHGQVSMWLNSTERRNKTRKVSGVEIKGSLSLILLPRDSLKTTFISTTYPLWRAVKNPNIRVLIDSETRDLSKEILKTVKGMIADCKLLKMLWGDLNGSATGKTWNMEAIRLTTRTDYKAKEDTIETSGVDVAKTGRHYNIILLDDIQSERNMTKESLQKLKEHVQYMMPLLEDDGELIMVGTRYGDDDVYSWAMELKDDDGNPLFDMFEHSAYNDDGSAYYPERLSLEALALKKATMNETLFSCFTGETPILMEDFTEKRIDEIKVGDYIVGYPMGEKKFVKSKVKFTNKKISDVIEAHFESGRIVRCTPDHKWWTGRCREKEKDGTRNIYASLGFNYHDLGGLLTVYDPRTLRKYNIEAAAYLRGLYDGEGSISAGTINMTQSYEHNPEVCAAIEKSLKALNFDFGIYNDNRKRKSAIFSLRGGKREKIRFLNIVKPNKKRRIIDSFYNGCRYTHNQTVRVKDKLVDIINLGKQEVYNIETETGNYIAWGYYTKNCQYLLDPIPAKLAPFKKKELNFIDVSKIPRNLNRFMMCDTIGDKKEDKGAWFAVTTWGIEPHMNELGQCRLYLLDGLCGAFDTEQQLDAIVSLYMKTRPLEFGIERAGMNTLKVHLENHLSAKGLMMITTELKPGGRGKDQRILQFVPYGRNGMVHVNNQANPEFLEEFLYEWSRFPKGKRKDVLDASAYLFDYLEKYPASLYNDFEDDEDEDEPVILRNKVTGY